MFINSSKGVALVFQEWNIFCFNKTNNTLIIKLLPFPKRDTRKLEKIKEEIEIILVP
jgi:hypothetical protein